MFSNSWERAAFWTAVAIAIGILFGLINNFSALFQR